MLFRSECHEGRPTKIEGNPLHPASGGATDIHAQAAILDLYSPDRSARVLHRGQARSWADFDAALPSLIPANGEGFYVLADKVPSPAVRLVREQLKAKFPAMQWHAFEPFDDTNALEGARIAFGEPLSVRHDISKATRILALDCDFLGSGPEAVRYSREFVQDRPKKRLYSLESTFTTTGAMTVFKVSPPAASQTARASTCRRGRTGNGCRDNPAAAATRRHTWRSRR